KRGRRDRWLPLCARSSRSIRLACHLVGDLRCGDLSGRAWPVTQVSAGSDFGSFDKDLLPKQPVVHSLEGMRRILSRPSATLPLDLITSSTRAAEELAHAGRNAEHGYRERQLPRHLKRFPPGYVGSAHGRLRQS